ncbi:MAG TPA: protein translocase subunit SecD [Acidimicrobiia bacterium]
MNRRRLLVSLVLTTAIAWGGVGASLAAGWRPRLGLDLQGGFSVLLTAPGGTDGAVLERAVEIMRRRIENLGQVQEPEIAVQGNSILVQLPGVTDRERALDAVGTTGELSFRPVLASSVVSPAFLDGTLEPPDGLFPTTTTTVPAGSTTTTLASGTTTTQPTGSTTTEPTSTPTITDAPTTTIGGTTEAPPTTSAPATATTTAPASSTTQPGSTTTTVPATSTTTTTLAPTVPPDTLDPETGLTIVDDPGAEAYLAHENGVEFLHVGPAFLVGSDITDATPQFRATSAATGEWVVDPAFTSEGGEKFRAATGQLAQFATNDPRRALAIVVDGVVFSAPVVADEVGPAGLDPDSAIITIGGDDQENEARDLATILRYGALPTTFEREREDSVSATLGSDSLQAGLWAGIAGLILVAAAVVLYYRILGVIAIVGFTVFGALLVNILILLGRFQGSTLTLAGVTGIIVSIGITADSYIVYFERIKEEHRKGRSLRPAVDSGFTRAFRTIITADTVSLAGAFLLWILAIGPVKGFALTLGIATVVDVVVAYFFTRPAVMLLVRSRFAETGALSIRAAMGGERSEPAVGVAS